MNATKEQRLQEMVWAPEDVAWLDALTREVNWDEVKHPREEDGKFADKGGDGKETDSREFDPNQPRDDWGRWSDEGDGAGRPGFVDAAGLLAARAKAVAKFRANPQPTPEEIAQNLALIQKYGHAGAELRQRGNNAHRRSVGLKLLSEFGDGHEAPCIYCGAKLTLNSLQRDRLFTSNQGGRYRFANLVPADAVCNKARGDTPFADIVSKLEGQ